MSEKDYLRIHKVLITLLVAVSVQIAGAIWWASDANSRLNKTEEWISSMQELPVTVAVMNVQIQALTRNVEILNRQLERANMKLKDCEQEEINGS